MIAFVLIPTAVFIAGIGVIAYDCIRYVRHNNADT